MCSGPMVMVYLNPCSDGEAESEPEERSHVQRSDGDGESEPETTFAVQRPDGQLVCTNSCQQCTFILLRRCMGRMCGVQRNLHH